MHKYKIHIVFALFLSCVPIMAQQTLNVKGVVVDGMDKKPLPGATVYLKNTRDSIKSEGTITDVNGLFSIDTPKGDYALSVSFLGFNKFLDTLIVGNSSLDIDTVKLYEEDSILEEINVVSTLAPTFQNGDTTNYNPDAFKVNLDATAGDLLMKMPGFYTVEGKLMAMGDTIKEVLMDGKKFFGDNISQALEMIPPKIIEKIEVYQYKSEGTKHSGFEESTEGKTVNIVTNLDKKAFVRAEISAGAGKDERYAGEGFYSRFMESNRLGISAQKNNVAVPLRINRGGGENSISGDPVDNNVFFANFGLSGATDFNVNYAFNKAGAETENSSSQEYVTGSLLGQSLNSENSSNNTNNNHDVGIIWNSKEQEKYHFSSNINFSSNTTKNSTYSQSETHLYDDLINSSSNNSQMNNSGYNLDAKLEFTKKLNDRGRSVSSHFNYAFHNNTSDRLQDSETQNGNSEILQNINQKSESESSSNNVSFGVSYNEKIGKNSHLSFGYRFRNYAQVSDKRTKDYDETLNLFSQLDSLTSNSFDNNSYVHVGKLGYRWEKDKFKSYVGMDLINTTMKSDEKFPEKTSFKELFTSFSPQVKLSYSSKKKHRYSLIYGMTQQIPSISKLQDIVDNTNPLYISTGNPNLKLSSRHSLTFSLTKSNVKKSTFTTIQFRASLANNMVASNRIVALNDTVVLGSYFLPAGGQYSRPVNLDGQYSLGINGTFSFPLKKLKSKVNSTSRINYSRTPNILNNIKNDASRINLTQGFTLASNISEKIDFTLNTNTGYSIVENTSNTANSSSYFSQRTGVNLYWNFYKRFIFKTSTNQVYTGVSGSLASNNRWFVNLSLSKKLFKENNGEITISAYDIANDQSDINRTVSDLYIAEMYRRTLNKFFMVSFSYTL